MWIQTFRNEYKQENKNQQLQERKVGFIYGLVWFYGISNIVGYLMTNTVFTFILNVWFVGTFCRYSQ